MSEPLSSNPMRYSGAEIHRGLCVDNHKHLRELQYVLASDYDRLRAAQTEVVRILSAIEFDGQAYEAIQRACKLLGAAEPNKLETVQQNKLNAAFTKDDSGPHAKRTADETSRCPHGKSWCFGPEAAENERRCLYCAGGSTGAA